MRLLCLKTNRATGITQVHIKQSYRTKHVQFPIELIKRLTQAGRGEEMAAGFLLYYFLVGFLLVGNRLLCRICFN